MSQSTPDCTKLTLFIKGFFGKFNHNRRKLRIWPHLLKKFLMENFIFYARHRWLFFYHCSSLLNKIKHNLTFAIKHWTSFIPFSAFLVQNNINAITIFVDKLTKFYWKILGIFQHVMIMSNTLLDRLPIHRKKIWSDPLGSQKTFFTVTWTMKPLIPTWFTNSFFFEGSLAFYKVYFEFGCLGLRSGFADSR